MCRYVLVLCSLSNITESPTKDVKLLEFVNSALYSFYKFRLAFLYRGDVNYALEMPKNSSYYFLLFGELSYTPKAVLFNFLDETLKYSSFNLLGDFYNDFSYLICESICFIL